MSRIEFLPHPIFLKVTTWIQRVARRQSLNGASTDALRTVAEWMENVAFPLDEKTLKQIRSVVRLELSRVPEPYRTAVVLRDIEGMSYEEIARVTGVPVGSVSSRLAQGRIALRDRLNRISITISS